MDPFHCFNELTKAPFEPFDLTLKTAFLLALAYRKCCSEIHAWLANTFPSLGQWEKVALFPSSDFIAKNQHGREGSQTLSLVIIPALTTIVGNSTKTGLCVWYGPWGTMWIVPKTWEGVDPHSFFSFQKGQTSDPIFSFLVKTSYATLLQTSRSSLSLEGTQYFHKFLPKRPDLIRQQQQYLSQPTSSSSTSLRSFPSD